MAVAAEALLRLRTAFDGSGIDRASRAIGDLQRQAGSTRTPLGRVSEGLSNINTAARRAATGGLVATGAGLTYSIAKAVEFENSLSDMKKALDLKRGSPMLNQLQDEFLQLSRRVPVAAKDLSEIGGIRALSGVSDPRAILKFTEDASKIATAFDMTGRDAAEALISIQAQLGLTDKATLDLMGTVNRLSDEFPGVVDPRDIIAGMKRGLGALTKTSGLTGEQGAGFLTAFLGAGVPLENAITGAKNFLKVLTGGDSLSKEKMVALEQLFGVPVDPVRKQLQDQLDQINRQISSGIDGVGQRRSDALEKLIDDAKFQGKKLIDFEGQAFTLSQAGLIKKKLDSETSAYTKGLKERAKAIKAQLKAMPGGGQTIATDLARQMQVDPTGTIMDVLQRIKQLPKDQQAGVMNQIFGDESILAISAITENLGLVKKGFDLSADATKNATSWLNEYNNKLENTSSQFQLLKNAFNEMAIRVGTAMLPVLTKGMQDLTPTIIELIPVVVDLARAGLPMLVNGLRALLPYVQQFTGWVKGNAQNIKSFFESLGVLLLNLGRVLVPVFAAVINAVIPPLQALADWTKNNPDIFKNLVLSFLAFKLAARMFGGFIGTFFKVLLASFALGALGFKQSLSKMLFSSFVGIGFGKLLQPLLSAIFGPGMGGLMADAMGSLIGGAVLTKLGAFFASIRSWFGMATKAVGPLAAGLGAALGRVGAVIARALGPLRAAFAGLTLAEVLPGVSKWVANLRGAFAGAGTAAKMFFDTLRGFTPQLVFKNGEFVKPLAVKLAEALRGAFAGLGNIGGGGLLARLGQGVMSLLPILATVGRAIAAFFSGPVGWITLLATAVIAAYTFRDQLVPVFTAIGGFWNTYVATPIRAGWTALTAWFATSMGSVGAALAPAWQAISTFFNTYVINPLKALWQGFVFYVLQTIQAYAIVWWQSVAPGFQAYVVQPILFAWNGLIAAMVGIGGQLARIWDGIAANFYAWVVTPIQTGWAGFTQWFFQSAGMLRQWLMGLWQGVGQSFYGWVVTPIQQGWGGLVQWLGTSVGTVRGWFGSMWNGLSQGFSTQIATPIRTIWASVLTYVRTAWSSTTGWFYGMFSNIGMAFNTRLVQPIRNTFAGLVSGLQNLVNGLFGWLRNAGNFVVDRVNNVRRMAGLPLIDRFAKGGYVNGPTLAWVGEGKDSEYIIPSGKMAAASMAYLSGVRGPAVLNGANNIRGFAKGGVVGGSPLQDYRPSKDFFLNYEDPRYYKLLAKLTGQTVKNVERSAKVGSVSVNGQTVFRDEENFDAKLTSILAKAGLKSLNKTFTFQGAAGRGMTSSSRRSKAGTASRGMSKEAQLAGLDAEMRRNSQLSATSLADTIRFQMRRAEIMSGSSEWVRGASTGPQLDLFGKYYGNRNIDLFGRVPNGGRKISLFAKGGYVKAPTLGLIGEGRDNEYIIPERRMAESAMAFLNGARGPAVLNRSVPGFASGGVVGPRRPMADFIERRRGGDNTGLADRPIEITTGPVMQFEGQNWATMDDLQRVARDVRRQTLGEIRTAAGRRATGR